MSRDIKYIGMDVHKEAIVIAVPNGSGNLVMESIVETRQSICCRSPLFLRRQFTAVRCHVASLAEDEACHQIGRVIGAGVAAGAVVVGAGAVEFQVAGVLEGQPDVLLRPPAHVEQVTIAARAALVLPESGVPCPNNRGSAVPVMSKSPPVTETTAENWGIDAARRGRAPNVRVRRCTSEIVKAVTLVML